MRVAFIDLGTNSVRFDVQEINRGGDAVRLHLEKIPLRLGESVFSTNNVSTDAIRRAIEAFASFKQTALQLDATKIVAVATSALRDAENNTHFVEAIKEQTGIDLSIISGEEEARLIAAGVLKNEKDLSGPFVVFDLGGGSTEMILCENSSIIRSASLNLGALRLQQVYLKAYPPRPADQCRPHPIHELRHHVRCELSEKIILQGWPPVKKLIGASGTARALAKVGKKNGDKNGCLERETLENLVVLMGRMTREELVQIPGMEAKRTDIILAGAILLEEIFDVFRARKMATTEYSLRDGLLDREISMLRALQTFARS